MYFAYVDKDRNVLATASCSVINFDWMPPEAVEIVEVDPETFSRLQHEISQTQFSGAKVKLEQ